ncbi:MAG TPA: hypothetical protein VFZ52_00650 [Chryseolinea sp.]
MKTTFGLIPQVVFVAAIVMLLQSCSNKTSFLPSPVVPAAQGSVKVKNDKNSNYVIDLNVMHLAQPERLHPSKTVYVVWMLTQQNGQKNIGQLKTSSGFLSRTLKSSLETVSSFEPMEIMITAEDNAAQQYPGYVVLRTGPL